MKLAIGNKIYNTDQCVKHRDCIKVTDEALTPRVTFRKVEVLCHQRHNTECFFNWVTVYKFIDGNQVTSYTWIQDVDEEELREFDRLKEELASRPKPKRTRRKPEPTITPDERHELKKQRNREYYYKHREEQLARKKEYYWQNKQQQNDYSKQYYQEHKDTWNDKYRKTK